MTKSVKRVYRAPRRADAAQRTRETILAAATRLFVEQGYTATTMAAIAAEAGVAQDTVYATVGAKPVLFRLLIERAISGAEGPVPALEREYVRAIQAEPDARRKLALHAAVVRATQERLAPLFRVLHAAASADRELAELWSEIAERRARNMRLLAADLHATGALRTGVSIEHAADVIWATNASEFYTLLVQQRGWTTDAFEHWLADAWQRLLLTPDAHRAEGR